MMGNQMTSRKTVHSRRHWAVLLISMACLVISGSGLAQSESDRPEPNDAFRWNSGWSSHQVAAARAPGDLGPLVPVRVGISEMLIPDAYLSDISRRHGLNEGGVILDGLFPNFEPVNRRNVAKFQDRSVNEVIRVSISGLERLQPAQRLARLNVHMNSFIESQKGYAKQDDLNNVWVKTIWGENAEDDFHLLQTREEFLIPHVMGRVNERPPSFRWYAELASWDDFFYSSVNGFIDRVIRCTNHLVPDPTNEQLSRVCTPSNPCGPIRVPYCEHSILYNEKKLKVNIRYRRVFYEHWIEIEGAIKKMLGESFSLAAQRRH
jgi:hypothetical protein